MLLVLWHMPIIAAVIQNILDYGGQCHMVHVEVDKPGPGNFRVMQLSRWWHLVNDRLRKVLGWFTGAFGKHHGDIGSKLTVVGRACAFKLRNDIAIRVQKAFAYQVQKSLNQ